MTQSAKRTARLNRWAALLIFFAAVVSVAAFSVIIIGLLEPPPVRYANVPFPTSPQVVEQGQPLVLDVVRCFDLPYSPRPLVYSFTATMISEDGQRDQPLQSSVVSSSAYGCESVQVQQAVPVTTTPGRYFVSGDSIAFGTFRLTPFIVPWTSESFTVIERTSAGGEDDGL